MQTFESLLDDLDHTLREYNMAAYENLLPPLPDAEIDENLMQLGIEDENVKSLFQWKGGVRDENGYFMMKYGVLLTFSSIKGSVEFNNAHEAKYSSKLIPLISDNGEDMLLFNTNPGPHYGKLYLFSVPMLLIEEPVSYYDSLYSMVQTTIDAYKEKAYMHDDSAMLDMDEDKFESIAKKYNKVSVYWKYIDSDLPDDYYEI